jgi:hypothetical protein
MKADLEAKFREAIKRARVAGQAPRDVIAYMKATGLIASEKQAWRTLEKWCRQNKYKYGVTLDLGWLLPYEDE